MRRSYYGLLSLVVMLSFSANSALEKPIQDLNGYSNPPAQEKVVRVQNTRIVLCDYKLLKRDFPELRDKSNAAINKWLLENASFVSYAQASLGQNRGINSKIDYINPMVGQDTGSQMLAFRPEHYGRALVLQVGPSSFLDVKGAGAADPYIGSYSNGLATLSESIQEFVIEKLVEKILHENKIPHSTVGTYAVLDFGFDVLIDGKAHPAGLIVRQAHIRNHEGNNYCEMGSNNTTIEIEKTMRRYGLSSCGMNFLDYPPCGQFMNIQRSVDGSVIDFGTYIVVQDFKPPFWEESASLAWEMRDQCIAVDPKVAIRVKLWGVEQCGNEWVDHLANWVDSWAKRIRKNSKERTKLVRSLHGHMGALGKRWKAAKEDETKQKAISQLDQPLIP